MQYVNVKEDPSHLSSVVSVLYSQNTSLLKLCLPKVLSIPSQARSFPFSSWVSYEQLSYNTVYLEMVSDLTIYQLSPTRLRLPNFRC